MSVTSTQLEDFIGRLERHDWTYEFSDDGRVWRNGMENQKALEAEARTDTVLAQAMEAVQAKHFGDGNYADRVLRCAEQLNAIRDSLKDPT